MSCKICGCTDTDACFHPEFGTCWWMDEEHTICSHCFFKKIYLDPKTKHGPKYTGEIDGYQNELWRDQEEPEEIEIEYESENGYKGILYGQTNMSIYMPHGYECLHTGLRNINTYEELKVYVDEYPDFLKEMEKVVAEIIEM